MPASAPPLLVRLRHWVGDVVLSVPTLQRLSDAGHPLHLMGKRWAVDLLAGHGWPVQVQAADARGRIAQMAQWRHQHARPAPGHGCNALVFPYSFSSALESRLAGLKAMGYAHEGRSLLLRRALKRPDVPHELQVYWHLGSAWLGAPLPEPARIGLQLSAHHLQRAEDLKRQHGIQPGYLVICPFAGGTYGKLPKTWPHFSAYAQGRLKALGRQVLICPGPGEEAQATTEFAGAVQLPGLNLGAYAALLRGAAAMISNDTGPGHLAAAVETPLLSVLGPTLPQAWGAWGPTVHTLRRWPQWPTIDEVDETLRHILQAPASTRGA